MHGSTGTERGNVTALATVDGKLSRDACVCGTITNTRNKNGCSPATVVQWRHVRRPKIIDDAAAADDAVVVVVVDVGRPDNNNDVYYPAGGRTLRRRRVAKETDNIIPLFVLTNTVCPFV